MSGRLLFQRVVQLDAWTASPTVIRNVLQQNPQYFARGQNGIRITGLRVQFKIEKHVDAEPNTCEVTITNCNPTSRRFLEQRPLTVALSAGYDNVPRYLFTGDLRWGFSKQQPPEWMTQLTLADGDRAYRYARVNRSYKRGTPILTALKEIAAGMNLKLDAATLAGGSGGELLGQFAGGRALSGPARDEITRILAPFGYRWSLQDGKLQILKDGDARAEAPIVVSQDTGMISSPEWATPDKPGKPSMLKVKMLLYPELTPGGLIRVQSRATNGIFRVERVVHSGDTHGDDWHSEIEAKALPK